MFIKFHDIGLQFATGYGFNGAESVEEAAAVMAAEHRTQCLLAALIYLQLQEIGRGDPSDGILAALQMAAAPQGFTPGTGDPKSSPVAPVAPDLFGNADLAAAVAKKPRKRKPSKPEGPCPTPSH